MSDAQKLFDEIDAMPLNDLLKLCALAIEEKMETKRLNMLLLLAETKLNKYTTLVRLGMKPE